MVDTAALRDKLQTKLFSENALAIDVELKTQSSSTNSYGYETSSYTSGNTIRGVPYNEDTARLGFRDYAKGDEANLFMAVPFDTAVKTKDVVVYEGDEYDVVEVQRNPLQGNLVYILRLVKRATH